MGEYVGSIDTRELITLSEGFCRTSLGRDVVVGVVVVTTIILRRSLCLTT